MRSNYKFTMMMFAHGNLLPPPICKLFLQLSVGDKQENQSANKLALTCLVCLSPRPNGPGLEKAYLLDGSQPTR